MPGTAHHSITLDALRVLDAINSKGSFAAAAEALYKVPSALTYTMQKLESDLGIPLFDRSKQRARLTPAGLLVLEQGREILLAASRLEEAVKQLDSGWETHLCIARDTVIPESPLLELVKEFIALDKNVEVSILEEALGGGWDALHTERADIVIGASGELPKGLFEVRSIGEIEFIFAVAPTHPLATVDAPVDGTQIRDYPLIVVADSSQTLPGRSSGVFDNKQLIRVNSMAAKINAQRLGIGVGFIPRHMAQPYLASGELVEKACAVPRPSQPLYVAWPKESNGKALKWFSQAICQVKWV